MSTLARIATMLTLIPQRPAITTAQRITTTLRERGFTVGVRTVQRDLVALSKQMPLVADGTSDPYRWGWAVDSHCPWVLPL